MNKRELIKYISQNSGENESWGNLVTKKKVELEQIYEYLQKVKEFDGETPEPIEETGLGEGVTLGGDPELEIEISGEPTGLSDEIKEEIDKIVEEVVEEIIEEEIIVPKPKKKFTDGQEYVSHKKPSGMSAIERKAYERTGRLPKRIKQNKYTRFDNEDVKFGF